LLLLGFCSLLLEQSTVLAQSSAAAPPARPAETIIAREGSAERANSNVDWRFAHPDADMKASINLQALLNSPAIAKAIEQGRSQAKDNAMQVDLVLAILKTVDRISVSVRQEAGPAGKPVNKAGVVSFGGASAGASANPDVLVQVTGSFDPQVIEGFFPSTGASKVKVVGPHTILIGEGDSFAQAVRRMAGPGSRVPGDDLEQDDIWISASYSFLAGQANGTSQTLPPAFRSLRKFSLGFNMGETPEINMLLTAADAAGAGEIFKAFQELVAQVAQLDPKAGTAAKALSLKQDGTKLRMHFVLPPELVAMAQQQAVSGGLPAQLAPLLGSFGIGGGSAAPAKQPAGTITAPPPAQNGGKIMIYGLDGGPKEVPAK
jgi:hypothetical protein